MVLTILLFPLILALGALCPVSPVGGEESAALGAGLGEGSDIDGKLAVRVIAAAVEGALLFAYLLHNLTAALRAFNANLNQEGLGRLALGVAATGQKLSEAPGFDYHWLTTFGAVFVGCFLQFYLFHKLGGITQGYSQRAYKNPEPPSPSPCFHGLSCPVRPPCGR